MVETRNNPKAFIQGAARMTGIVQGVRTRQTIRVGRSNIPLAPSTLYRRIEKAADFRPEQSSLAWPSQGHITNNWVAGIRAAGPSNWRTRMPWPLRWVMGWP
jgi:hypothetical protein